MQQYSVDATLSPYARFWNVMKHEKKNPKNLQKIKFVECINQLFVGKNKLYIPF